MTAVPILPMHRRRLRDVYRSAGWPCLDGIEIELLGAGLVERVRAPSGHETLRVTDAGIALLADTLARNRAGRDAHEVLVERVAEAMTRAGRLAWRGLALRARIATGWVMARPDVYSIRHTSVEDYVEPVAHEIKVRRADLLADLRKPDKREAYRQLSTECWYVIRQGIAEPDEVPLECGVLVADDADLVVARPAPKRAWRLPFGVWMALARATPVPGWRFEDEQGWLGDTSSS